MSLDNIVTEAISLSDNEPAVLLPMTALSALLNEVRKQREEIDHMQENLVIAFQLIQKIKGSKEPQDSRLLDELYKEMTAIGRKQVDFATAARMVKRSKSRMLQLKGLIALDERFVLKPSESHSQKNLIRLADVEAKN